MKPPRRGDVDRDTAQADVRRIYGVQTRPLLGGRAMIHLVLLHTESSPKGPHLSTDVSASVIHNVVRTLAHHALGFVELAGFQNFTLDL